MIITNPIYEAPFKQLMENKQVAKFFMETVLNAKIGELKIYPHKASSTGPQTFRLCFVAIVEWPGKAEDARIIDIQKLNREADLIYLGPAPEIRFLTETIYILDFKLPSIETAYYQVEPQPQMRGASKNRRFINRLKPGSHVIQLKRIGGKYQTRLEKLLSFFEQAHFVDEKGILKDYPYEWEDEALQIMGNILHHTGSDPETRKEIETEQEAWRSFHALFGKRERELMEELEQERAEKIQREKELEQERAEKARMRRELEELKKRLKD